MTVPQASSWKAMEAVYPGGIGKYVPGSKRW
jgi:hypothetical protein